MKYFLQLSLVLLSTGLGISSVLADKPKESTFLNGSKLSFSIDDSDNFHPDIFLPLRWSDHITSSIEYRTSQDVSLGEVPGSAVVDSGQKTTLDKTWTNLVFLNYQNVYGNSELSFGLGYSIEAYDKNQAGFVTTTIQTLTFDSTINIEATGISLTGDYIAREMSPNLSGKFSVILLASPSLDVDQKTILSSFPNGTGSSSQDTDAAYEFRGLFNYNLSSFIDLGFEMRYKHLPLKYDLQLANTDTSFETVNFDVDETITYAAVTIHFKSYLLGNFRPTVGISAEKTEGSSNIDNESYNNTETMIIFGITSAF